MSARTHTAAKPAPVAAPSPALAPGGTLQRRGTCGEAAPALTNECTGYSGQCLTAPGRAAAPSSAPAPAPDAVSGAPRAGHQPPARGEHPTTGPHFGHDFGWVRVRAASEVGFEHVPHAGALPNLALLPAAQARPPRTGGAPLKPHVLGSEGPRLGIDLSGVRLHQDEQAARAAETYHARAFTFDDHIFAGRGVPDLQSHAGRDVLLHELTHVAQGRRDPGLAGRVMRLPESEVVTQLEARLTASDKPGFFQVLRVEAATHATSAVVRKALSDFFTARRITQAEAWRAVCLQVFGNETTWPRPIKNFVEGVENGQFTPPAGMPPATNDALWETATRTAHTAAEPPVSVFDEYRLEFNSLWLSLPYRTKSAEFNPAQSSKGPRSDRARAIFEHIYATNARVRSAYDIPGGVVRHWIDEYFGPDALNIEASPRVNTLRNVFRRPPLAATTLTDPDYVAFKTHLTTAAQALDSNDRQAVESSHEWQSLIERIVPNATVRADVIQTIREPPPPPAGGPAPPAGAPSPPAGGPAPPPAGPAPLKLSADQQTFVTNLSLAGPASPMLSSNPTELLSFTPGSTRDPAGLNIGSRVDVTPTGLIREGARTENPWPPAAATGAVHTAKVQVEGGTTGFTDFVASLSVIPATGTITHTAPTATVRVQDERRTWFAANIRHGLIYTDQNINSYWSSGSTVSYYGGQQALSVRPWLTGGNRNPGLTVFMQGRLSKNGAALQTFPRMEFGRTATATNLGGVTVLEATPPPTTPDNMELVVEFFPSADPAAVAFQTLTQPFKIRPGGAFSNTTVIARAAADHTFLNSTSPGGILPTMLSRGGQVARTAQAIQAGNILLEPFLIRADSAAYVRAHPGPGISADMVAYLMGHPAAADDAHTMIAVPGADAWRWPRYPNSVFINITPTLAAASRRSDTASGMNGVIDLIVHESVHALDYTPGGPSGDFERYKKEFRAYWADGQFDRRPGVGGAPGPLRSTAFDPSMDNRGPKSEKARKIFEHLYGSPTYPFVRPAYNNNTNNFREQVNAYIIPDAINIIVSVRLDNLRRAVQSYTGAGFPAHLARIRTLYGLCDGTDKREITGNRAWRDLVDSKYVNNTERASIKAELRIP